MTQSFSQEKSRDINLAVNRAQLLKLSRPLICREEIQNSEGDLASRQKGLKELLTEVKQVLPSSVPKHIVKVSYKLVQLCFYSCNTEEQLA